MLWFAHEVRIVSENMSYNFISLSILKSDAESQQQCLLCLKIFVCWT